jgi:bifunctional enzyme CysN/CysC
MDTSDLEKMNIVIVGHVDHGKSTIIGRLLADTGSLPKGKLEQIQAYCEQNSMPFEYAFLIDALKDERRQNITIDSARVFFKSSRRHYIIIDAPGHIEFVKNMVTGAARAEAALLVIDAQEGVQENSRRHGNLLSLLGIRQLIVLINKMDLVGFDQARFEQIRTEYAAFLDQIGLKPDQFIPVSAHQGDNISHPGTNMPWYTGPTALEALDAFSKDKPLTDLPFRMPVQDVYRFTRFGDSRRIIAGTVASGSIQVNDEVAFYPSGKRSTIQTIESMDGPGPTELLSGQAAGFTLSQQIYVKRGDIAVRFNDNPPRVAKRLRVSLFWLGREAFVPQKTYVLKLGTARSRFQIEAILRVVNTSSLENNALQEQVGQNEVAECILSLEHAMAFDYAEELPETGRFVIVDGYEIRGGGIVLEGLPDSESGVRETVFQRNLHWVLSDVNEEERSERYKQRACLAIITGHQGIGRKRLARALESHLFHSGSTAYFLGMGSVVYGVDADIRGHAELQGRHEHVRRIAEIANLFLDAGLILIVTAVDLTQADLELFQTIVDPTRIVTILIGDPVTSDIQHQLELKANQPPEESLPRILEILKENGFIGGFYDRQDDTEAA